LETGGAAQLDRRRTRPPRASQSRRGDGQPRAFMTTALVGSSTVTSMRARPGEARLPRVDHQIQGVTRRMNLTR
jgi:hypothetical protein